MATNEEIIRDIKNGLEVKSNMYQLYKQNLTLMKRWSSKYIHQSDADDVLQECYIAMHNAVQGFDAEKEYKFISYLKKVIDRHFSRELGAITGIRMNAEDKKLLMQYRALNEKQLQTTGEPISDYQVCCLLHCKTEQLNRILQYTRLNNPICIDAPINDSETGSRYISDTISADINIEKDYEEIAMKEYSLKLWEFLHNICTDTEEIVIKQRFKNNFTLKQIGINNNISPGRVRQCETQALQKLRTNQPLRKFANDIYCVSGLSYRYGFASWNYSGASAVERSYELLEKLRTRQKSQ